jgi:iron-sulfur cluster repair protein YtfE (RIC family)
MPDADTPVDSLVALREGHAKFERTASALGQALAGKDKPEAARLFRVLEELVERHMSSEEEIGFPLAERLAPTQASSIKSLRLAHISMRSDLATVGEQIERGHLNAAHTVLDGLVQSMEAHEALEDKLISALED